MAAASGDKFSIANILELNKGNGVDTSSSSEAPSEPSTISESEGEGSSASKPKKRTAPADGDDNNTIKRTRTTYTRYQLRILEHHYIGCRYPDTQALEDLVKKIRIPKKKVQVWFQNRRARSQKRETPNQRHIFSSPVGYPFYYAGVVPLMPEAPIYMQHTYPYYNNPDEGKEKE